MPPLGAPSDLALGSLRQDLARLLQAGPELAQAMLRDHRHVMSISLMLAGPLSASFWFWDWAYAPHGATDTMLLRLLFLLLLPSGLLMARLRVPAAAGWLLLFSLLWTQVLYCVILTRMENGMLFGQAGFPIFYIFVLLIGQGLPMAWPIASVLLLPAVPVLLALAGWLPGFSMLGYSLLAWPMSACTLLIYVLSAQNYLRRKALEAALEQASNTDALTGLSNRRHFMPALEREWIRAVRMKLPLSVLMVDIDHFKQINDRHGHPTGDTAIRALAQVCREGSREMDWVARLGGEEFALLLPGTELPQAVAVAERIRRLAEGRELLSEAGEPLRFTVSIGVAVPGPDVSDGEALLARADAALYQAKQGGRNQVRAALAERNAGEPGYEGGGSFGDPEGAGAKVVTEDEVRGMVSTLRA